eukprot:TRINITY_DN9403_c0_g1_i1.p1 TRINITY_DN9403_c0_g1~~TRINITY_DN9403_c0_g1_i1.p1  ORF type:complete len:239 (+),score=29.36 TRINITY_DN9403_c0_g1_i1:91-807(+)
MVNVPNPSTSAGSQGGALEDLFTVAVDEADHAYFGLSVLSQVAFEDSLARTHVPFGPLPPPYTTCIGLRQPTNDFRTAVPSLTTLPWSELSDRSLYTTACALLGVRPNSAIVASLPETIGDHSLTQLVVSPHNFLSERGVLPILEVVRASPALRRLDLPAQGLFSPAAEWVAECAISHPSLTRISLRDNRITIGGGKALEFAARANRRIVHVDLDGNLVDGRTRRRLEGVLESNRHGR